MGQIRIWKLGNLEHKILPTKQAVNNLKNALENWNPLHDLDLVWGPELSLEIFKTENSSSQRDVIVVYKGKENDSE